MTDMVERVAKAMFGRDIGPAAEGRTQSEYCDFLWSTTPSDNRETYREMARAAIAAMREPTEAVPTRFGIAVEQIYVGDVVVIEDGAVRRARQEDGPLTEIPFPPTLRDMKIMIEKEQPK